MHDWLVVFRHPSEKSWSSSVGMIKFPRYGKITNVPSHQPDERERYIYIHHDNWVLGIEKGIQPMNHGHLMDVNRFLDGFDQRR